MTAYVARRILQSLVVLLGVTIIVFILIHLLPGGPARAMLGPKATPQQVQSFIVQNGYNKPLFVQYGYFLGHLLEGNLGFSYSYNESVTSLLAQNVPKTALLVGAAYVFALVIAIPLGILQATKRNSVVDHVVTGGALVGYSMPVFWLATLLILWLSIDWHVFPSQGPQGSVGAAVHDLSGLVLPVASLTVVTVALFSRFVRSSAISVLVEDYIRTARAVGAPRARVLFRHLLRNCLTPLITLLGLSLPGLVGGAIVVESVFNYPGMGLLLWRAATTHDYPLLMGITVVVGAATVVGNLIADVLYAAIDPRVHYGRRPA